MSDSICPICHHPVIPDQRTCANCGVDLALAAVLTERALLDLSSDQPVPPVTPEVLVPRLGERLVEQGFLAEDDLRRALAFQREQEKKGKPILVGQALVRLGMVNQPTLDRTITQQIFQLQDALRQANRDLETRVQERTRDLQQALDQLTELNQLKSNFIANITHELRTPLTHIKGYTELLSDGSLGALTDKQTSAFQVMERSIRSLETLISDLIQFSESARGEISLRLSPFPVGQLFQRALAQADERFGAEKIKLILEVPDDLPHALGDFEKISWVVMHLVDNAIKFSGGKEAITLAAALVNDSVQISVIDTGIGIPEDRLDEIFEPFHQLDTSSTRRYGGTGLGLSLVRGILEAHKTEITVTSTIGEGSTFSFTLPATDGRTVV
ncbi:MAG TPA: ATP-binding protein [Anaerolineales bacterium]|nr:ATP-binding protein [Anaerolineales bacterium]